MNPLTYWALLIILASLLTIFCFVLIYNLYFLRHFANTEEEATKSVNSYQFINKVKNEFPVNLGLIKFNIQKNTQGDIDKISHDAMLTNKYVIGQQEADDGSDFNESPSISLSEISNYSENVFLTNREVDKYNKNNNKHKYTSASVDDLEFCDPHGIETVKEITRIEDEAKRIEKEMSLYVGPVNDLLFYDVNGRLIRLTIALCEISCERDELRRKKQQVLEYIQSCKAAIKSKTAVKTEHDFFSGDELGVECV